MEYTVDSGHTSYSFDYGSNESGVLKEFYAKLGYYMNISDSEIEEEIEFYEQNFKEDITLGKAIKGEPLLSRLISDQRALTLNKNDQIGEIYLEFESGTRMWIKTASLDISEYVQESEDEIMLHISIDKDSDIRLNIDSKESLENPLNLFTPLFDAIGVPLSTLENVQLFIRGMA